MKALAEEVGISANAIKKYEHDSNMPTSSNLLKLAKALNVRTEYFFRPIRAELKGLSIVNARRHLKRSWVELMETWSIP